MIEAFKRVLSIEDLRDKIAFTLLLLLVTRIGVFISVPGINGEVVLNLFRQQTGGSQNLFQLVDVFNGGAFSQMTIFALGILPYISSSIIMQLVTALVPELQRELRETPDLGKRRLIKWTRILTLALAAFQSYLFARYAYDSNLQHPGVIDAQILAYQLFMTPVLFYVMTMVTMTTGTLFLMWVGEQITEKGIGNGISLIISANILSSLPSTMGAVFAQLNLDSQEPGQLSFASLTLLMGVFVSVIVATILIIQGQRKIPLQYARRVVGRMEVQGSSAHIPLKVNYAGVIPVIFASSVLMFPATIASFIGGNTWLTRAFAGLYPGSTSHTVSYVLLIICFSYFWTATQFHPDQIASDMKKNGAFIPGVRQGKPTRDFLESTMSRVTLIGALFLAMIAIFPTLVGKVLSVDSRITYFFGGTSLLILVGVTLDTLKQIESHLIMKRYDGFMKHSRVRGR